MNIRFFRSTIALTVLMVASSIVQASTYPILFIKIDGVDCNTGCNTNTGHHKSLEINDLEKKYLAAQEEFKKAMDPYYQELRALNDNPINYQERHDKIEQKMKELTDKINSNDFFSLFYKKIEKIIRETAKEKGACAVIAYHPSIYNYVDQSCDITDEVYDRLNQEYLKTKNK